VKAGTGEGVAFTMASSLAHRSGGDGVRGRRELSALGGLAVLVEYTAFADP